MTLTTATTVKNIPFRDNRELHLLLALSFVVGLASAIHPEMVADWWLENLLVFGFVGLLALTYRKVTFSGVSYLLFFVFFCLHEYGAHYKYYDVPPGEWLKPILHTKRNDYDRIVHFSFGLLIAYPIREMFIRFIGVTGVWSYILPADVCLALGAGYEIMEALVAEIVSPETADAFVGLQGDIWDSQKDMGMGFLGASVAMVITAYVNVQRRRARLARAALQLEKPEEATASVRR